MSKRPRQENQQLEVQGLEPLHDRPIPAWERDAVFAALRRSATEPADGTKGGPHASGR
jgi:hypothetical protein